MTTAILLAAGYGNRLGGRDKPTLRIHGEALLTRHMRQARIGGASSFVIVANPDNITDLHTVAKDASRGLPVTVVLQDGVDAHAAALTGLRTLSQDCESVFVAGITDVVPDDTYLRVARNGDQQGITIATAVLERTFVGGMLAFHPGTRLVQKIVERPPGGCPPGHLVNIWIHHLRGSDLIRTNTHLTASHGDYEDAVNATLANGTPATAVVLPWWEAVKDPASLRRAERLPHRTHA